MNVVALIDRKRQGEALSAAEIELLIAGFTAGRIADYQMSAFAMAVCCRGMTAAETAALTRAMVDSGTTLTWHDDRPIVDKHSTGGIGDKSSLVLAPLLAECDLLVPMLSGRGLGFTGGTLDKLEAIPGYRTQLSAGELRRVATDVGCVIAGQTADLVPADRKLYALRDATGTVASVPLVTASILSKKVAEGLQALVLDVKRGTGSYTKTAAEAQALADSMTTTSAGLGLPAVALVTDMDQPTGRWVGNAAEVNEAILTLDGHGPADLLELVYRLGSALLVAIGKCPTDAAARSLLAAKIASGAALDRFHRMARAQGGSFDGPLPVAPLAGEITADRTGVFTHLDGAAVGYALTALGGGRRVITDAIDPSVAFEFVARLGDRVSPGSPLIRIHSHPSGLAEATSLLQTAIRID